MVFDPENEQNDEQPLKASEPGTEDKEEAIDG